MKSSERNFARRIDLTSLQLFVAVCEQGTTCPAEDRGLLSAAAANNPPVLL